MNKGERKLLFRVGAIVFVASLSIEVFAYWFMDVRLLKEGGMIGVGFAILCVLLLMMDSLYDDQNGGGSPPSITGGGLWG